MVRESHCDQVVSSRVLGDHPPVVLEELTTQGVVPAVVLQLCIVHKSCTEDLHAEPLRPLGTKKPYHPTTNTE